jgi:hypothetical protein
MVNVRQPGSLVRARGVGEGLGVTQSPSSVQSLAPEYEKRIAGRVVVADLLLPAVVRPIDGDQSTATALCVSRVAV